MKFVVAGLIVIVIGWFTYTNLLDKQHTAFYYPESGTQDGMQSKEVGSVKECREWADSMARADGDSSFDYQCGVNCRYDSAIGETICETDTR